MGSRPALVAGTHIRFYLDNGHVRFAGPGIWKLRLILYKTRSRLGTDRSGWQLDSRHHITITLSKDHWAVALQL